MLTKLEEKKNELPGVMIEIQPVRNYLYKELAVHAIGYVGEVSNYDITEGSYKNMPVGGSMKVSLLLGEISQLLLAIDIV